MFLFYLMLLDIHPRNDFGVDLRTPNKRLNCLTHVFSIRSDNQNVITIASIENPATIQSVKISLLFTITPSPPSSGLGSIMLRTNRKR